MLDATKLATKLYQGSYPYSAVRPQGFHVLVLCAEELQRRPEEPDVLTLRCPLRDDGSPFTQRDWHRALRTADQVVELLLRRRRVLITCAQGRNRSGLVAGIVLYRITPMSGAECVRHIQSLRPGALSNDDFVAALAHLPAKNRVELGQAHHRALHRAGPSHQFIW